MKAKIGQVKIGWSKKEEDIMFSWGGGGAAREDAALIMYMLDSKYGNRDKTFLQELEERGYDLSTLRISIQKKETKHDPKAKA